MGAEALLGQGDMLYMPPGTGLPARVHGAFVHDDEVHRVVESLKEQGEPNYVEGLLEGALEGETGDGDRKRVEEGKGVSVRVDLGGRGMSKKKEKKKNKKRSS